MRILREKLVLNRCPILIADNFPDFKIKHHSSLIPHKDLHNLMMLILVLFLASFQSF